jgi:hypothetical protein
MDKKSYEDGFSDGLRSASEICGLAAELYRKHYSGPGEPFGAPPLEILADVLLKLAEKNSDRN